MTNRHMSVGPTLVPGIRSSTIRAGHKSMSPGVLYNLEQKQAGNTYWRLDVTQDISHIITTKHSFIAFTLKGKNKFVPISQVGALRGRMYSGIT